MSADDFKRGLRKRAHLDGSVIVGEFKRLWCDECEIFELLRNKSIDEIAPLCPKETLNTCPMYKKIQMCLDALRCERVVEENLLPNEDGDFILKYTPFTITVIYTPDGYTASVYEVEGNKLKVLSKPEKITVRYTMVPQDKDKEKGVISDE